MSDTLGRLIAPANTATEETITTSMKETEPVVATGEAETGSESKSESEIDTLIPIVENENESKTKSKSESESGNEIDRFIPIVARARASSHHCMRISIKTFDFMSATMLKKQWSNNPLHRKAGNETMVCGTFVIAMAKPFGRRVL